jgi:hypothetical protein
MSEKIEKSKKALKERVKIINPGVLLTFTGLTFDLTAEVEKIEADPKILLVHFKNGSICRVPMKLADQINEHTKMFKNKVGIDLSKDELERLELILRCGEFHKKNPNREEQLKEIFLQGLESKEEEIENWEDPNEQLNEPDPGKEFEKKMCEEERRMNS